MRFLNVKLTDFDASFDANGSEQHLFKKYSGTKLLIGKRMFSLPSWIPIKYEKAEVKVNRDNFNALYNLNVHRDHSSGLKISSDGKTFEAYIKPPKKKALRDVSILELLDRGHDNVYIYLKRLVDLK